VDRLANAEERFAILFNPSKPGAADRLDLLKHLSQWLEMGSKNGFQF